MAPLLSTMLFAATASAQVTTSFWMPYIGLGTDNIGFVGSVINANQTHTTVVVDYDEGTNKSALGIGDGPQTMTIGPTIFGTKYDFNLAGLDDDSEDGYSIDCDWPTPEEADSNRTCTVSYPQEIASLFYCEGTVYDSTTADIWTRTHTYPARGSEPAGTETIRQTFSYGYGSEVLDNTAKLPECSASGGFEGGYFETVGVTATEVSTFYLVLTAGTEKLEATAAATPTMSSAMSTGTAEDATIASGSAALPEVTEAGAPMVTGAPLLVGLGAAVAAFFV
jgi:hypothetical protein